jgi:hypothetical protein
MLLQSKTVQGLAINYILINMRLNLLLLFAEVCTLCSCNYLNAGNSKSSADILLQDSICNMKTIKENGPSISKNIIFTNIGKKPLILQKVQTSCHCAQASFSKEPVMPNKQDTVTITLNPKEMFKGYFERTVTIYSNAKRGTVRIHVKGVVK